MVNQSPIEPLLRLEKVSKHFPGVQALRYIELDIYPGEIHAVLGENGAGKSTLMKILSGVLKRDEGEIFLQGRRLSWDNPREALKNGIALVYQELSLIPSLSIAENLCLGRWPVGRVAIDWKKIYQVAREHMQRFQINLDPATLVINLSVAEQQMVEILKAVSQPRIKILLLDEPTSALSDDETQRLFQILDTVKKENRGIIFISHKINEAMQIADRITILRDGEKVVTRSRDQISEKEIVFYMTGKNFEPTGYHAVADTMIEKIPVLSLKNLSTDDFLKQITLDFYQGEIVVVFGLIGSGKTTLAKGIMGLAKSRGIVVLKGKEISIRSPREAIAEGIGYIPEDRRQGLVFEMPVFANITLAILESLTRRGILNVRKEKKVAGDFVETLRIRTPNIFRWVLYLSGGNQQKVLLARWMARNSDILIMDEPTRGIDVGAKFEIRKMVKSMAAGGLTIVYLTSDPLEAMEVADRLVIMRKGRIVYTQECPERTTKTEILAIASGIGGSEGDG